MKSKTKNVNADELCNICFIRYPQKHGIFYCSHTFCRECTITYVALSEKILSGNLQCNCPECSSSIIEEDYYKLLYEQPKDYNGFPVVTQDLINSLTSDKIDEDESNKNIAKLE